jgi:hypothetical protein
LAIAGVGLRVHSDLLPLDSRDPAYLPFLIPPATPGASASTIDVEVVVAPSPRNDSPVLFEGGDAWDMRPDGEGYRLSFYRAGTGRPHTVACSDAQTTWVQVYVNQDAEPSEPPPERLMNPVRYPLDQLLLMNHLSARGGVIVHAAGAVVGGGALVFPGASGAGKSTLSRMLSSAGLGDSLLSDDRVILRVAQAGEGDGSGVEAWGTPWPGDAQIAENAYAPLAVLLFLVKAEVNELVSLGSGAAMRRLLPVVSCPWYDAERLPGVLDTCARVVENTPCYDLRFRPEGEAVTLLTGRSWARDGERA